jgi:hypothetical protein
MGLFRWPGGRHRPSPERRRAASAIDPAMDGWTLTKKIFHAKAPPALAPGLMIQLGLIGLAFTFTKE